MLLEFFFVPNLKKKKWFLEIWNLCVYVIIFYYLQKLYFQNICINFKPFYLYDVGIYFYHFMQK